MPYLNVKERVLETKIVYYGAGLSGKTTNLEEIKSHSKGGRAGEMMSLNTDGDRTLFFDWLPFDIGKINGCDIKVQLYTVPGQAKYEQTRKKVLKDADGIVLVLDSQSGALRKNQAITEELQRHLLESGLDGIPMVVQLNKRDLPEAMDAVELMAAVGLGHLPYVEAVACDGKGVFETLKEASRQVVSHIRSEAKSSSAALPAGDRSGLDGGTLYEEMVAEHTGRSTLPSIPSVETRPMRAVANGVPAPTNVRGGRLSPVPAGAPPSNRSDDKGNKLGRRLDALERAVSQNIVKATTDLERRLASRLGPGEAATTTEVTQAVEAALTTALEPVRAAVASLETVQELRLEGLQAQFEEKLAALSAPGGELEQVAALEKSIGGRLSRELANFQRKVENRIEKTEELVAQLQRTTDELAGTLIELETNVAAVKNGHEAVVAAVEGLSREHRQDLATLIANQNQMLERVLMSQEASQAVAQRLSVIASEAGHKKGWWTA